MPTIIPIPAFADNYIWLLREGASAAVVDAGDAAPVIAHLEREHLELTAIICTHHHGDHVGGNRELLQRWQVPVFGPASETIPGRTHAMREGDAIVVPGIGLALSVLDIPGHTAGHIAYVGRSDAAPLVFCGDTLFAGGCGRLFEGTPAHMVASLDKLVALPGDTLVYCGHEYTVANLRFALVVEPGNAALRERESTARAMRARGVPTLPSTIGDERATNPFLRTGETTIRAAASAHADRELADRIGVFAEIRAWKNAFR
ncbi:MAG: hydroxyacylglutathione hydrolase [Burkholderiales bacterium]|jgi:hydroxyacylglutathione hydrolase